MKILKLSNVVIVLLLLFLHYSSGVSSEIDISVNTGTRFPTLTITNPLGKNVIIQPVSSELGSIGFEKGGTIYWLTGKPEKKVGETGATSHLW